MSIRAFVLNWFGAKVPDDQMRNIEHPRVELQWYLTMKCMQVGAVLGYAYALRFPIMRYLGRPVPPQSAVRLDVTRSVMRTTRKGLVGGALASFPLAIALAYHPTYYENYHRQAYEIRKNKRQLNVDRGSLLVGLGVGAFYKVTHGFPVSLGFSTGVALGSIAFFLYNNYDWLYRKAGQKEKEMEIRSKIALDQLSGKAHEQVENAKGSFNKVTQQAQDRVEDAKGSMKKAAEDTKDKFRKVSEEGKGKIQEYSQDLHDLKSKAKENAHDFKNKAKDNVNEIKNKAKENVSDFKSKAKDNVNEMKNKAKENVNDFKNSSEYKKLEQHHK